MYLEYKYFYIHNYDIHNLYMNKRSRRYTNVNDDIYSTSSLKINDAFDIRNFHHLDNGYDILHSIKLNTNKAFLE